MLLRMLDVSCAAQQVAEHMSGRQQAIHQKCVSLQQAMLVLYAYIRELVSDGGSKGQ